MLQPWTSHFMTSYSIVCSFYACNNNARVHCKYQKDMMKVVL